MAKFHLNSTTGEPGKCRAQAGQCPYGRPSEHFHSADEARAAFQASMGDSFNSVQYSAADVKRRDLKTVASNSSDPQELMAVAEAINRPSMQRKLAAALADNPHTPPEVLVEARSRTDIPWNEFCELELHPNYPLDRMTGPGANRLIEHSTPERIKELLARDDVGDAFAYSAHFHDKDYSTIALANPNNRMSSKMISTLAAENDQWARAAGSSGRFPTDDDLDGTAQYHTGPVVTRSDGWSITPERMGNSRIIAAANVNPNSERLLAIYDRYKHTEKMQAAARAIISNPHASVEVKTAIAKDVKSFLADIEDLAGSA